MQKFTAALLATTALAWTCAALAQATPVGLWKTIDDESKQEKSLVRIADSGGVLTGRIEKLLDPAQQDAKCDKCEGPRKDQRVAGMTIMEGVRRHSGQDHWEGGTILDQRRHHQRRVHKAEGHLGHPHARCNTGAAGVQPRIIGQALRDDGAHGRIAHGAQILDQCGAHHGFQQQIGQHQASSFWSRSPSAFVRVRRVRWASAGSALG